MNGGFCICPSIHELNRILRRKLWKHLVLFCQFPYREIANQSKFCWYAVQFVYQLNSQPSAKSS